jgi:signal transduction histidine kinase
MRHPGDTAVKLAPNPDLDALGPLIERARQAGLPVELRVEGRRRALRAGLELGAYRVVQDALDDVLRVAPTARTDVLVRWSRNALEIDVADARPGIAVDGAGPQLVGVRERVALYGGELRTGPRPEGGHEVHVRFPLDDPPGSDQTPPDPVPAQGAA